MEAKTFPEPKQSITAPTSKAAPLLEFRSACCKNVEELLFILMTIGDDRTVRATYVAGECVYDRDGRNSVE